MLYTCSKCGEHFEKESQCREHERDHIRKETPLIHPEPAVYEGELDYDGQFIGRDGKQLLSEGAASRLISFSNINSLHDYKKELCGKKMRITVQAELIEE